THGSSAALFFGILIREIIFIQHDIARAQIRSEERTCSVQGGYYLQIFLRKTRFSETLLNRCGLSFSHQNCEVGVRREVFSEDAILLLLSLSQFHHAWRDDDTSACSEVAEDFCSVSSTDRVRIEC